MRGSVKMEHVSVNTVDVVNLKINGIACRAPAGATVLEAAHGAGIAIPTLCYLKELNAIGACRICVVEVKGAKNLVPACVYPIADGMEVYTNTERVQAARRTNLKLILSSACAGNTGWTTRWPSRGRKSATSRTRARCIWSETTPNASCAAGARLCAAWLRGWPASAHRAGASPPTSAPALTAR